MVGYVAFGFVILLLVSYLAKQFLRFYWHRNQLHLRAATVGCVYTSDAAGVLGWNDIQVDHITRTIFILWNDGSRSITADDLSEEEPICVGVMGHVLDVRLLEKSTAPTVRAARGGNYAIVNFDVLNGQAFSLERGFCLEIVHDGADWRPFLTGRVRGISLETENRKGRLVISKVRSWWAPILAGLGIIGLIASESVRENPVWFEQNFIFHRSLIWILPFFAALGVIAIFVGNYYTQVIAYGRSFQKKADKRLLRPGESPSNYNKARLWHQLVPSYLRRRDEVGEESFWEAYADRWSRKPALGTPPTTHEDGVGTTRPSASASQTGESVLKQSTKEKTKPVPPSAEPEVKLVRQQRQRQARSKRSGKR